MDLHLYGSFQVNWFLKEPHNTCHNHSFTHTYSSGEIQHFYILFPMEEPLGAICISVSEKYVLECIYLLYTSKNCHWDFVLHLCGWKRMYCHISNKYLNLTAFTEKEIQASFPKSFKQLLTQWYCYSSSLFRCVIGQKSIYLNRFVLIIRLTMIQSINSVQRLYPALWFKMWEHPPRLIESSRNNDIEKRLM